MLEDKTIHSLQGFSQTEKKLANIWRKVFLLSREQYESLTKDSDFFEFTYWCGTFEIYDLEQEIDEAFGISINSVAVDALDNYSTLCEQAAFIESLIEYGLVISFLTDWLRKIIDATETEKEETIHQLPDDCRAALKRALTQANWQTATFIVFTDIKVHPLSKEGSQQVGIAVNAKVFQPPEGALAICQNLDLVFTVETSENQKFRILSVCNG
jgi:hypothetical protein